MRAMKRYELGLFAERLAACWLQGRGYILLNQRVRMAGVEIDWVVFDIRTDQTVFVEVKSCRCTQFGFPEQRMSKRQKARYRRAAGDYSNHLSVEIRFDLIAVIWEKSVWWVDHFEDAF